MRPAALVFSCALLACKRTPTHDDAAPTTIEPNGENGAAAAAQEPTTPRPLPMAEEPRENVDLPVPSGIASASVAPNAPTTAAQADPYEAAVAGVRASAVGCFAGQAPGEYRATISVVVTPAGRATRVEASASIEDAAVIKCLEQAATRIYPSTSDGRKLSIDVHVKG